MKKSTLWILSAVAAAALLAGAMRWMSPPSTKATAVPSQAPTASTVELSANDIVRVQAMDMVLDLQVSGTLKASQSAMVKARVAGELMDLTVREGDLVKAGQVIARIDPTEYQARERQAKQQADAAGAQVDIAQKQYDNNKALMEQGFISPTALQNAMASLSGAKATHMAAVAAHDVTRKALDDAIVRAPISGQVAQRLAQPGERMAIDARIVEVVNLSQFEVEVGLPAADAGLVRPGMRAQMSIEGFEEPVSAKVLRISPSAQAGSRSVLVFLGIAGEEGLRQGLFAQGKLGTKSTRALAVPLASVRIDKPQAYVQVIDGEQIKHVTVQTGTRTEQTQNALTLTWVEVQGVTEGTQVLTASAGAVREGTQVKFAPGVR
ncbi:efflux RND transporter periplasmic adaptor subunit [Limnohabitans sp. G3-2]|uniref:efflux RND transporter periplasmic adaptor subunit n=1 Tax=Limnohabitans sp. G3-2 TaxID=1100711 RepID=UPI000C1E5104|nr:efflux RND transporter periplasmic adaptor subunit [Limnohabitans sp. G3-2]PIT78062.1 efflux transporter periplasmic adaptor subunit [Limnohabitans sp. G3-2]